MMMPEDIPRFSNANAAFRPGPTPFIREAHDMWQAGKPSLHSG
jgi:hypothetical protein